MTTEYTINRLYPKPDFDTRTWHDQMHTSLDMIDRDIVSVLMSGGFSPVGWLNGHAYVVGDVIFDYDMQQAFLCQVNHTSAAVGTFAADRLAHPTYWIMQGTPFTSVSHIWSVAQEFVSINTSGSINQGNNTISTGVLWENGLSLVNKYAPIASPVFTGDPRAPTPAVGDDDTTLATTAFVNASLLGKGGRRNILRRNGGLEIWQRGAGGSAVFVLSASATPVYTADGWYLLAFPAAGTVTQSAGLVNGSQWSAKVQRTAGQTGVLGPFAFPLDTDELYPMLGQYIRLSFTAKAGANWSPTSGLLSVGVTVGTGTPVKAAVPGFTGATSVISANQALTTTPARYQFNSSIIVPTTSRQAEVLFNWSAAGTAGADDSFFIDDVQLEVVPAATGYASSDFERLNFQEQLLLCLRHYQKTFNYNMAPADGAALGSGEFAWIAAVAGATASRGMTRLGVPMRVAPTNLLYHITGGASQQARNTALLTNGTATTMEIAGSGYIQMFATCPVSTLAQHPMALQFALDAGI